MPSNSWMSVSQVAQHIGVSREIIYKWIKERRLPAHRIGKLWKFQISEVDHWITTGGSNQHFEAGNNGTPYPDGADLRSYDVCTGRHDSLQNKGVENI